MQALVTGSSGFIGNGVASALAAMDAIDVLGLDRSEGDGRLSMVMADLTEFADAMPVGFAPAIVVHCAGITTAACEADADLAWRVNVEGTRNLLAWCRRLPRPARFVFTSSVAVFGGGEDVVDEASLVAPRSTYGAVKAIAEQLVLDATRRGEIDGIVVRLPITIVRTMRSGRPGAGYLSDLIINAINGSPFVAPLAAERVLPVASSRQTFALIRSVATAEGHASTRVLHVPAIAATGVETLAALRRRGFEPKAAFVPEPPVEALIAGWPNSLDSRHQAALGFDEAAGLDQIIEDYLHDRR